MAVLTPDEVGAITRGEALAPAGFAVVPLSRGMFALVDDCDLLMVSAHKWSANRGGSTFYAVTNLSRGATPRSLLMHRLLLSAPPDFQVDHANLNGLDNRRSANIRLATRTQNRANQEKFRGLSPYKGVSPYAHGFRAFICAAGRKMHIGVFQDEISAAKAYDVAALQEFGEFARLNFPMPGTS